MTPLLMRNVTLLRLLQIYNVGCILQDIFIDLCSPCHLDTVCMCVCVCHSGSAQELFLVLLSGITFGGLRRPYGMPRIEPWLVTYKTHIVPTVLSLWLHIHYFNYLDFQLPNCFSSTFPISILNPSSVRKIRVSKDLSSALHKNQQIINTSGP